MPSLPYALTTAPIVAVAVVGLCGWVAVFVMRRFPPKPQPPPAPAVTTSPAAATGVNIWSWLPFTQQDLAQAASVTTRVAVDYDTYQAQVTRFDALQEVGRVLHPILARGQIA